MVIFSFCSSDAKDELLVNAVCIPFEPMHEENELFPSVVCLLASLCCSKKLKLTRKYSSTGKQLPKRKLYNLIVEEEAREKLWAELEAKDAELEASWSG